jgi:hypothetical protein
MTWFVERLSRALSAANLKPLKISRAGPLMKLGSAEHWVMDSTVGGASGGEHAAHLNTIRNDDS